MIGSRLHIIMGNKRLKISDVIRGAKVSRPRVTGLYYGRTKGINFETLDRLCAFCSAKLATSFTSKKSIKPRQHGNADRAKGESWNRFTSILTRRE
ncbi:helix-turn-helix domain-containing protein [Acidaminococcus sp.]|uniref:helix-turn-helix domain-containing protein n=1 Tax=Acidaminococcus sp. TaxID=1872103 RepID=UPI0039BFD291